MDNKIIKIKKELRKKKIFSKLVGFMILIFIIFGLCIRFVYLDSENIKSLAKFISLSPAGVETVAVKQLFKINKTTFILFSKAKKQKIFRDFITLARKQKRADQKLKLYLHALRFFPNERILLANIAAAYALSGEEQKSFEYNVQALKAETTMVEDDSAVLAMIYANIANYYVQRKDYVKAKNYLKKSLDLDASLTAPYYLLGYIAHKEKNSKQCIFYYDKVWEKGFKSAEINDFFNYAECIINEPSVVNKNEKLCLISQKAALLFPETPILTEIKNCPYGKF